MLVEALAGGGFALFGLLSMHLMLVDIKELGAACSGQVSGSYIYQSSFCRLSSGRLLNGSQHSL